jgi:hypothetical protein
MRKYKRIVLEQEKNPNFDECKEVVQHNAEKKDAEFIEQFLETQMFAYYFDIM